MLIYFLPNKPANLQSPAHKVMQGTERNIEDVDVTAAVNMNKPIPEHLKDKSQRYCVLTVVAPQGTNQKSKDLMIRVYGCRGTLSDANKWAKRLRDSNQFFDVYTLKCHEWAPMPPRIECIDNVQSMDDRIQKIHDQFKAEKKGQLQELETKMMDAHKEIAVRRAKRQQQEEEQAIAVQEEDLDAFSSAAAVAAAAVAGGSTSTSVGAVLDADAAVSAVLASISEEEGVQESKSSA